MFNVTPSAAQEILAAAARSDAAGMALRVAARQVADGSAEDNHQAFPAFRNMFQMKKKVSNHAMYLETWVFSDQFFGDSSYNTFIHIKGDVISELANLGHRIEGHAGFCRRAAS